jgi:hypothetical protein
MFRGWARGVFDDYLREVNVIVHSTTSTRGAEISYDIRGVRLCIGEYDSGKLI